MTVCLKIVTWPQLIAIQIGLHAKWFWWFIYLLLSKLLHALLYFDKWGKTGCPLEAGFASPFIGLISDFLFMIIYYPYWASLNCAKTLYLLQTMHVSIHIKVKNRWWNRCPLMGLILYLAAKVNSIILKTQNLFFPFSFSYFWPHQTNHYFIFHTMHVF